MNEPLYFSHESHTSSPGKVFGFSSMVSHNFDMFRLPGYVDFSLPTQSLAVIVRDIEKDQALLFIRKKSNR